MINITSEVTEYIIKHMHESKDGIYDLSQFLLPCLNCNSCKASLAIQLVKLVQFSKDYRRSSMAALYPVHICFLARKEYMRLEYFSFFSKGRDGRDGTPGPAGPAGKGLGILDVVCKFYRSK